MQLVDFTLAVLTFPHILPFSQTPLFLTDPSSPYPSQYCKGSRHGTPEAAEVVRIVLFDLFGSHWQPHDDTRVCLVMEALMHAELQAKYAAQLLRRDSQLAMCVSVGASVGVGGRVGV